MPGKFAKSKMLAALDTVAKELETDVPAQAVASWLLPIFVHIRPAVVGEEIPKRVAELSALVGIKLGVKTEED